jgi:DNA-binding SARP family transcriptional activator
MEFRILGPLEVLEAGRSLQIPGGKARALLAILLLNANEVQSTDRLIDLLWGEDPPATADKALQVHVSQLRKALTDARAPNSPIHTRPPGYVLALEAHQLDLLQFLQLVDEGRRAKASGDVRSASDRLHGALALWRGSPLSDFTFEPFAHPEISRLEELRLAAIEDRLDADLDLGRHTDVTAELEALVGEHPLRERLRAQLMVALYRAGRQADALQVYDNGRRILGVELGIDPGPALQDLHVAFSVKTTVSNSGRPKLLPSPRASPPAPWSSSWISPSDHKAAFLERCWKSRRTPSRPAAVGFAK